MEREEKENTITWQAIAILLRLISLRQACKQKYTILELEANGN